MGKWIALFRGINVGGNNILPMAELRVMMANLGALNVQTYIQSGNCIFEIDADDGPGLAEQISTAVEANKSFRPQVMLLTSDNLATAIHNNPFLNEAADLKHLQYYFMDQVPDNPDISAMERLCAPTEAFQLHGRVFYLHAPDGIGRSKLAERAERLIGVPMTARNGRTVAKLADMAR